MVKLFDYSFIKELSVPIKQAEILSRIQVCEERINIWKQYYPEAMEQFYTKRIFEDVCSTHDIEHIAIDRERSALLIYCDEAPRTANENKVLGQYEAIQYCEILKTKDRLVPEDFLEIHRRLMIRHDPNGGTYRSVDYPHMGYGTATTIEKPVSTKEIRYVINSFCRTYNAASADPGIDNVILALCATLDFFSISPFENGNGRMYRLLLNLFLGRAGISIQTYAPLEKYILEHLENHFVSLKSSTKGWGCESHAYDFFIDDILHNLSHCVRFLDESLPPISAGKHTKSERIAYIADTAHGSFSAGYVNEHAPDISSISIYKQLSEMVKNGELLKEGNTRSTTYRKP